jgi:hypothetical protein
VSGGEIGIQIDHITEHTFDPGAHEYGEKNSYRDDKHWKQAAVFVSYDSVEKKLYHGILPFKASVGFSFAIRRAGRKLTIVAESTTRKTVVRMRPAPYTGYIFSAIVSPTSVVEAGKANPC